MLLTFRCRGAGTCRGHLGGDGSVRLEQVACLLKGSTPAKGTVKSCSHDLRRTSASESIKSSSARASGVERIHPKYVLQENIERFFFPPQRLFLFSLALLEKSRKKKEPTCLCTNLPGNKLRLWALHVDGYNQIASGFTARPQ